MRTDDVASRSLIVISSANRNRGRVLRQVFITALWESMIVRKSASAALSSVEQSSASSAVGVAGRIGAATQMPGAIISGFCKPSIVGPYEERYIPRFARSSEF